MDKISGAHARHGEPGGNPVTAKPGTANMVKILYHGAPRPLNKYGSTF